MRILVTNDDGIFSEGITRLAEAIADLGEVIVVAPDREQSATSRSLTLHRPLRIRKVKEHWFTVDGTPTDCVSLAVQGLLKEAPPDLVLSGINFGVNMGDDVTYSGTVSGAFEANQHDLPGIAFSQEIDDGFSFARAARIAHDVLAELLRNPLPPDLLLNINIPAQEPKGVRWTRLGKRVYEQSVVEKTDPRGRKYYWIAGTPRWESLKGTDYMALSTGYLSVTPLHLDLTDYRSLEEAAPVRATLEDLVWPGAEVGAEDDVE